MLCWQLDLRSTRLLQEKALNSKQLKCYLVKSIKVKVLWEKPSQCYIILYVLLLDNIADAITAGQIGANFQLLYKLLGSSIYKNAPWFIRWP